MCVATRGHHDKHAAFIASCGLRRKTCNLHRPVSKELAVSSFIWLAVTTEPVGPLPLHTLKPRLLHDGQRVACMVLDAQLHSSHLHRLHQEGGGKGFDGCSRNLRLLGPCRFSVISSNFCHEQTIQHESNQALVGQTACSLELRLRSALFKVPANIDIQPPWKSALSKNQVSRFRVGWLRLVMAW